MKGKKNPKTFKIKKIKPLFKVNRPNLKSTVFAKTWRPQKQYVDKWQDESDIEDLI